MPVSPPGQCPLLFKNTCSARPSPFLPSPPLLWISGTTCPSLCFHILPDNVTHPFPSPPSCLGSELLAQHSAHGTANKHGDDLVSWPTPKWSQRLEPYGTEPKTSVLSLRSTVLSEAYENVHTCTLTPQLQGPPHSPSFLRSWFCCTDFQESKNPAFSTMLQPNPETPEFCILPYSGHFMGPKSDSLTTETCLMYMGLSLSRKQ